MGLFYYSLAWRIKHVVWEYSEDLQWSKWEEMLINSGILASCHQSHDNLSKLFVAIGNCLWMSLIFCNVLYLNITHCLSNSSIIYSSVLICPSGPCRGGALENDGVAISFWDERYPTSNGLNLIITMNGVLILARFYQHHSWGLGMLACCYEKWIQGLDWRGKSERMIFHYSESKAISHGHLI